MVSFPTDLGLAMDERPQSFLPHWDIRTRRQTSGFLDVIRPVQGCMNALTEDNEEPCLEGTIPIHADIWFGAAIIRSKDSLFEER